MSHKGGRELDKCWDHYEAPAGGKRKCTRCVETVPESNAVAAKIHLCFKCALFAKEAPGAHQAIMASLPKGVVKELSDKRREIYNNVMGQAAGRLYSASAGGSGGGTAGLNPDGTAAREAGSAFIDGLPAAYRASGVPSGPLAEFLDKASDAFGEQFKQLLCAFMIEKNLPMDVFECQSFRDIIAFIRPAALPFILRYGELRGKKAGGEDGRLGRLGRVRRWTTARATA